MLPNFDPMCWLDRICDPTGVGSNHRLIYSPVNIDFKYKDNYVFTPNNWP